MTRPRKTKKGPADKWPTNTKETSDTIQKIIPPASTVHGSNLRGYGGLNNAYSGAFRGPAIGANRRGGNTGVQLADLNRGGPQEDNKSEIVDIDAAPVDAGSAGTAKKSAFAKEEPLTLHKDQDSDDEEFQPTRKCQHLYDILKFVGVLLHLISLCLFIAQKRTSRFASKYLLDIFFGFLLVRPIVIFLFTLVTTILNYHQATYRTRVITQSKMKEIESTTAHPSFNNSGYDRDVLPGEGKRKQSRKQIVTSAKKIVDTPLEHAGEESDDSGFGGDSDKYQRNVRNIKEEIEFEHPDIPSNAELFANIVLLPIVIYSGFGRVVVTTEKRKTFLQIVHAQELALHTIPLGLLIYYNNRELGKQETLDTLTMVITIISLVQIIFEFFLLKCYQNMGKNLERRPSMKSGVRLTDLMKVATTSILCLITLVLLGSYAFSEQQCVKGYFEENSVCKDCALYVDPYCEACDERAACLECRVGYFPIDNECIPCTDRFGEFCQECSAAGCLDCSLDFFISYGQCRSCAFIDGCKTDSCGEYGCTECMQGYYLDEGNCNSCSAAISGCVDCRNADICLECASEFLTIDQGICKCREGIRNQFTDPETGACQCEEGFYMTTRGCQTCEYLIPGCQECVIDTVATGIELYQAASFSSEKLYLNCLECQYSRYVQAGSSDQAVKCQHCSASWDGCSSCGTSGYQCDRCYQTHVFTADYERPCVPCYEYMRGCAKCANQQDCIADQSW